MPGEKPGGTSAEERAMGGVKGPNERVKERNRRGGRRSQTRKRPKNHKWKKEKGGRRREIPLMGNRNPHLQKMMEVENWTPSRQHMIDRNTTDGRKKKGIQT